MNPTKKRMNLEPIEKTLKAVVHLQDAYNRLVSVAQEIEAAFAGKEESNHAWYVGLCQVLRRIESLDAAFPFRNRRNP